MNGETPTSVRAMRLVKAKGLVRPRQIINLAELAAACGVSDQAIRKELGQDPDFPVVQRGGNGVEFKFSAHRVINYMLDKERRRISQRRGRLDLIRALGGITVERPNDENLSVAELKAIDAIQLNAQKRKIQQGEYVLASEHERAVSDIFTTVQTEVLAMRAHMDPAGHWEADFADAFDESARNVLVKIRDKLEEVLIQGETANRRGRSTV